MPQNLIVDGSALVALLSRDDQHHRWITAQAGTLPWPWLTCEVVLAETFYLVGRRGVPILKELLRGEVLTITFDLGGQLESVLDLMDKYADVPMSLADACLVRMTEILPDPLLITTDADFKIYRRHSRHIVPCLMP